MRLRNQLLLVSILLLSLPWAGCQYILSIDATLQFAQEQSLKSTTQAIAAVLAQEPETIYPNIKRLEELLSEKGEKELIAGNDSTQARVITQNELFFKSIDYPIIIDGYGGGEWADIPVNKLKSTDTSHPDVRYQTVSDKNKLYLFFEINDQDIIYHNPTLSYQDNGDRLVLVTGNKTHYIFTTSAPGTIKAYYKTAGKKFRSQSSIKAAWQDHGNGYTLEISMPIKLANDHLGFYIVNESTQDTPSILGTASDNPDSLAAWLVYQPIDLTNRLNIFMQPGTRIFVIDKHFWPLSQTGELTQTPTNQGNWLLRKLYRAILKGKNGNNPTYHDSTNQEARLELQNALNNIEYNQWYEDPDNTTHSILSSAIPVVINGQVIAAVLAEQSSDRFVALTDDAFNQLLLFSLVALAITGIGLLGYVSWLSWRIQRLSQSTQEVLKDDGTFQDNFPNSSAADEIGDLTRSYATLLHRIHDYTDYLQTLSRKLSHELRTPLAIIHSSLDNLEHCTLDENAQTYHKRAKDGASRLGNILTAMSEATRVEQSIQNAEYEPVNLAALLHSVSAAYRDLHKNYNIQLQGVEDKNLDDSTHIVHAVPDLIVQTLDKLVDNAVDFCPEQGAIIVRYELQKDTCTIEVSNDGPLLPETMQHQLFDNMVSLRTDKSDQSHLGLGLHIAHLIIKYHNGKISAVNRADKSGVTFKIILPKKTDRSR